MELNLNRSEEKKGLLVKKTWYILSGNVNFSPEELAIIEKHRWSQQILTVYVRDDGVEMPEQAFLARLVIVGRHDERSIHFELFRGGSRSDRFHRGIRPRACKNFAATVNDLDREPDNLLAFVM